MRTFAIILTILVQVTPVQVARGQVAVKTGREHWAFKQLATTNVPRVDRTSGDDESLAPRTPIDNFILAKLHEYELGLSPEADRRTLIRRVYLDLIGLPPNPGEVDAFVADPAPDAYERLLDKLLASPHFGERWGRHWLDVVGYVDAIGFEVNAVGVLRSEDKWRYRDYVIDAYNKDKPFDQFIREQIAGDELVDWRDAQRYTDVMRECLIATGYLRTAQDFTHEPESNIPMNYFEVLQGTIDIFGKSLLGLSLDCVQCHSHKYDPVPHEDYYRLMAVLTPAYNPHKEVWRTVIPFNDKVVDRALPAMGPADAEEVRLHNEKVDQQVKELQNQIAVVRETCKNRLMEEKAAELARIVVEEQRAAEELAAADGNAVPANQPVTDGLSLWLSADQDVYTDDGGNVPASLGQPVSLWKDRLAGDNAFGNDLMQVAPQHRPVLVEGIGTKNQRALRFETGKRSFLRAADHPSLRPADGLSIFAIYRLTEPNPSDMQLVTKYEEGQPRKGGNWGVDLYGTPKRLRFYFGAVSGDRFHGDALTEEVFDDTNPHQLSAVYDAGSVSIRMDHKDRKLINNAKGPPPSPTLNDTHQADLMVGARATTGVGMPGDASAFLSADVAEILIYQRALSGEEILQVEDYLSGKYGTIGVGTSIADEEVAAGLSDEEKTRIDELERNVAESNGQKRSVGKIQALWDVGPPPTTFLSLRGSYEQPGPEVQPGYLQVLCEPSQSPLIPDAAAGSPSSGRRLALARWLTQSDSRSASLLARVKMNRIWQHLFGNGLVTTTNNFGMAGPPPSHPELLEWLASEYVEHDWSTKRLIKSMTMSSVYRQISEEVLGSGFSVLGSVAPQGPRPTPDAPRPSPDAPRPSLDAPRHSSTVDPGNRLLWRMPLRRLEAEVIRDCILATSGQFDSTMAGPPIEIEARNDGTVVIPEGSLPTPAAKWRRSIYLLMRRSYHVNLMCVFDQPVMATNCGQRDTSAVPLQSLTMLNDPLMVQQSRAFAARVAKLAGSSLDQQISVAYQLSLSRRPEQDEASWCRDLLVQQKQIYQNEKLSEEMASQQALVDLCQALLNASEFLYVH